ncbi:unnamed protein product [Caretta caretta]
MTGPDPPIDQTPRDLLAVLEAAINLDPSSQQQAKAGIDPGSPMSQELCHVVMGLSVQETAVSSRAFVRVSGSRAVNDPVTPSIYLPSRILWSPIQQLWSTRLSPSSSRGPVFLPKGQRLA